MRVVKMLGAVLSMALVMLFVPLVAAAMSAEAVPLAGPAPLWSVVGLVLGGAVLGVGAIMSLRLGKRTVRLDTDDPTSADLYHEALEEHVQEAVAQAEEPLREELSAQGEDLKAYRDMVIGEILRVGKLSAGDDYDAEEERAYLETLTPAKLKLHYDRAVRQAEKLELEPRTRGGAPAGDEGAGGGADDPYAEAYA